MSTYVVVTGVTVELSRLDPPHDRRTVAADANGRFAFEDVEDGRYQVSAAAPGYTTKRLRDGAARFDAGDVVTVRTGKPSTVFDLQLRRTSSVSGRVVRPNGAAAPGIDVVLAVRRGGQLVPLEETRTTTAWDGRYAMTELSPGDYLLLAAGVARPPATLSQTEQAAYEINATRAEDFVQTLYPGVPSTEAGAAITLIEGVPSDGVDIWLTPARRFSISGRVVVPDGAAVERIAIEYGHPADRQASVWTVSDPGGLFTIDGVSPGTVVLMATADSTRGPLMGITSTTVHAGDVEDLTVTLVAPATIEGRVTFGSDVAKTMGPQVIALVPTLLHVSPLFSPPVAPIGADGSFRLTNALGEYEFVLPDLAPGLRITTLSRNGEALPHHRIGVAAGEFAAGIVVTIGR